MGSSGINPDPIDLCRATKTMAFNTHMTTASSDEEELIGSSDCSDSPSVERRRVPVRALVLAGIAIGAVILAGAFFKGKHSQLTMGDTAEATELVELNCPPITCATGTKCCQGWDSTPNGICIAEASTCCSTTIGSPYACAGSTDCKHEVCSLSR